MSEVSNRGTDMREIAELDAKINLLLAMNSISNAELTLLHDELARRNEECARLNEQLAQRNEELPELTQRGEELVRLHEDLARQNESAAQLSEELAGKTEALTLKDRQVLELDGRLAALHKSLGEAQLISEAFQSTNSQLVASLRSELVQQSDELAQLNQKLARTNKTLTERTLEVTELNDRLGALYRTLEEISVANEAFQSSMSWRLTTPFRSTMEFVKKQFLRGRRSRL